LALLLRGKASLYSFLFPFFREAFTIPCSFFLSDGLTFQAFTPLSSFFFSAEGGPLSPVPLFFWSTFFLDEKDPFPFFLAIQKKLYFPGAPFPFSFHDRVEVSCLSSFFPLQRTFCTSFLLFPAQRRLFLFFFSSRTLRGGLFFLLPAPFFLREVNCLLSFFLPEKGYSLLTSYLFSSSPSELFSSLSERMRNYKRSVPSPCGF